MIKKLYNRAPVITTLFLTEGVGCAYSFLMFSIQIFGEAELYNGEVASRTMSALSLGCIGSLFFFYPIVLTVLNIYYLFSKDIIHERKGENHIEIATIFLGSIFSLIYLALFGDITFKDWQETLYNAQKHTPIATWAVPTVLAIALVAFAGYLVLRLSKLNTLPPLVVVLCMAALYLGIAICVVCFIQITPLVLPVSFFLFNCVVLMIKTIRKVVAAWDGTEIDMEDSSFIGKCNKLLNKSKNWPWIAFLLMWPLLGILIIILTLLGQRPDSIIRAWTETSDWSLSKRVAPQNVMLDEHYLCTVAAGGHKKIVKPIRLGKRHGHEVIVNRQLCIANAFEEVLQEKMPGFHKAVRYVYDTYGYPFAKHIHSPYIADAIYILMKPLEWCFLAVLYLVDAKPENRIAVQYLPKELF